MIKQVSYNDSEYNYLCNCMEEFLSIRVAEQRKPGGTVARNHEEYPYVCVCFIENKPVGCMALSEPENGIAELGRVYVKDEYRNSGIGTKLYNEIEKIAKGMNVNKIILDTYARLNEAVNLYKKVGFYDVPKSEKLKDSPYSLCMEKNLID